MYNEAIWPKDNPKVSELGGEQLAQDKEPMSETELLEFMAGRIKYGYPATRYRTMHPDDVDPSDIAKMSGEEWPPSSSRYSFRLPRYSRRRSTIVATLTNQLAKIFYTTNAYLW